MIIQSNQREFLGDEQSKHLECRLFPCRRLHPGSINLIAQQDFLGRKSHIAPTRAFGDLKADLIAGWRGLCSGQACTGLIPGAYRHGYTLIIIKAFEILFSAGRGQQDSAVPDYRGGRGNIERGGAFQRRISLIILAAEHNQAGVLAVVLPVTIDRLTGSSGRQSACGMEEKSGKGEIVVMPVIAVPAWCRRMGRAGIGNQRGGGMDVKRQGICNRKSIFEVIENRMGRV